MRIFTIGHSNHDFSKFVELLKSNAITTLFDVRTAPYSRYNWQFNEEELKRKLPKQRIQYVFAGKFLGGRPSDPTCYRSRKLPDEDIDYLNEVDYAEIMKREWFVKAIQRLLDIASEETVAIMCSEEDPAKCHRHHLIAKYLMAEHPECEIRHIRGDGNVYGAEQIKKTLHKDSAEQLGFF